VPVGAGAEAAAAVSGAAGRFRGLLDSIQDVYLRVDAAGRIALISSLGARALGYGGPGDLVGRPAVELWADPPRRAEMLAALEARGAVRDWLAEVLHRDGRRLQVAITAELVRDAPGGPAGFEATWRDVVERRRAVELMVELETSLLRSQRLEAVGQLAGGVAHDFNNLLTVQLTTLSLLEESALEPGAAALVAELRRSAEAAAGLSRQLLAFARRDVLRRRRVDLVGVVDGVLGLLRRVLPSNVALELHHHPAPVWIDADPGMMEQLVMNLAVNARDAMPGGGRLTVRTEGARPVAGGAEGARLVVADTGHGMDEVTRGRAFEPLFTTKPPGVGTGLGLATVAGIVERHGATLRLETSPGVGAVFTIEFPAGSAGDRAPAEAAPRPAAAGGGTILLVEDEPAIRRAVGAWLRRAGHHVLEAEDAAAAHIAWRAAAGAVEVLITDLVLPGEGGLQLARALAAERPDLAVVLMSGWSPGNEGIPESGQVTWLQKPFDAATLATVVAEVLGRRPAGPPPPG
jgi:PAS domain S-box-containing protein